MMPEKSTGFDGVSVGTVIETWSNYCRQLESLGSELVAAYSPDDPASATETLHHLTRLLRTSLEWQVDGRDSKRPRIVYYDRSCAASAPFAPNLDNSYLLAKIDDAESYRLSLDVDAIDEINISLHTGSPYDGNMQVIGDLNLDDLEVVDGRAQIVFSAIRHEGAWFEMPKDADYMFIRFYYFDWHCKTPPSIELECISIPPARPLRLDHYSFATALNDSLKWLGGAMHFGGKWAPGFLNGAAPNVAGPMRSTAGGGSKIRYGGFKFQIEPGEAAIVTFEKPEGRYWSIQWQMLPWGDPIDFLHHQMSLNHTQLEIGSDNIVRVVIAHQDPGVRNWLDTGGSRDGLVMYRWIWCSTEPQPEVRVVRFEDVGASLPSDTAHYGPDDRAEEMAARRRHLSLRF